MFRYESGNNLPFLKEERKVRRKNMSPSEKVLWQHLRKRSLTFKFRRQFSVDHVIIPIFSFSAQLAIYVDIGSLCHSDLIVLMNKGIKILYFTENQIFENMRFVLNEIELALAPLKGSCLED